MPSANPFIGERPKLTMFGIKNWMAKPMERKLFYVCRATDTVKDLPFTENRMKSVSPMFYTTRRAALIDLKEIIEQRVQNGVCQIIQIERELAKNERKN